jgi:nucleoside-triphosphatase THEP1
LSKLIGLTGKSGTGKTKACQKIVHEAQNTGLSVFGFYCPAVFKGKEKTGIQVCLLPDEEIHLLGTLEKQDGWLSIGRWWMDPSIFECVNDHLKKYNYCDWLIIDEIGPAEIENKKGWPAALNLLKEGHFQMAVVSFRPAYIDYFKENFPDIKIINLDKGGQAKLRDLMDRFCKPKLPV